MDVGQLVEGAAQVVEALLVDQRRVGRGGADQPQPVGRAQQLVARRPSISSARLVRRQWSIAALRAISKIQGLKAISASVARMRRRAEKKASWARSSARASSRTMRRT